MIRGVWDVTRNMTMQSASIVSMEVISTLASVLNLYSSILPPSSVKVGHASLRMLLRLLDMHRA